MGYGVAHQQSWPYFCDVCGKTIHVTNFMKRSAVTPDGDLVRINTHQSTHMDVVILNLRDTTGFMLNGWTTSTGNEATIYRSAAGQSRGRQKCTVAKLNRFS